MNRAVNSIVLNIAEGAARSTERAFDNHLEIALGSAFEVTAAAFIVQDQGYITEEERRTLYTQSEILAKQINAFRKSLHQTQP